MFAEEKQEHSSTLFYIIIAQHDPIFIQKAANDQIGLNHILTFLEVCL
jgi:hypothetical protein